MTTWLILNSVAISAIALVLFLTLRQLGYVLHRVGPVGARGTDEGPRVGENLEFHLSRLSLPRDDAKPMLLVFGSESCGVCATVRAGAEALLRAWKKDANFIFIYDSTSDLGNRQLTRLSRGSYELHDTSVRHSLGITFVPFALVVNRELTVIGKGLVNDASHLESLLELERAQGTKNSDVIRSRKSNEQKLLPSGVDRGRGASIAVDSLNNEQGVV